MFKIDNKDIVIASIVSLCHFSLSKACYQRMASQKQPLNWQKSENKKLLLKTSGKKFIFKLNCLVKVTLFKLKKLTTPNKSFKTFALTLTNPEVVFSDGSIRQLLIF